MNALTALLVGVRQLFSWRSAPRPSPRSLCDSDCNLNGSLRNLNANSHSDHNRDLSHPAAEKFAELLAFAAPFTITCWTPPSEQELEQQSQGVSEVYTYHQLPDGTIALGLVSWMCKDRAFDYVKQAVVVIDTAKEETLFHIEGPAGQIKPILVKLISFLRNTPHNPHA